MCPGYACAGRTVGVGAAWQVHICRRMRAEAARKAACGAATWRRARPAHWLPTGRPHGCERARRSTSHDPTGAHRRRRRRVRPDAISKPIPCAAGGGSRPERRIGVRRVRDTLRCTVCIHCRPCWRVRARGARTGARGIIPSKRLRRRALIRLARCSAPGRRGCVCGRAGGRSGNALSGRRLGRRRGARARAEQLLQLGLQVADLRARVPRCGTVLWGGCASRCLNRHVLCHGAPAARAAGRSPTRTRYLQERTP
jgi:hypothetical protein